MSLDLFNEFVAPSSILAPESLVQAAEKFGLLANPTQRRLNRRHDRRARRKALLRARTGVSDEQLQAYITDVIKPALPTPGTPPAKAAKTCKKPPAEKASALWHRLYGPEAQKLSTNLRAEMARREHSPERLSQMLAEKSVIVNYRTIRSWQHGHMPAHKTSFIGLRAIAEIYGLPPSHFVDMVPVNSSKKFIGIEEFNPAVHHIVAHHLPENFNDLPDDDRKKIFGFINSSVLSGQTDYRQYLSTKIVEPYRLHFRGEPVTTLDRQVRGFIDSKTIHREKSRLVESRDPWSQASVEAVTNRLGTMFGALSAPADSPTGGLGIPVDRLNLCLVVFDPVVEWFLSWAKNRRGFFNVSEVHTISIIRGLTARDTGWLRDKPPAAGSIHPIAGLLTDAEIKTATEPSNWDRTLDRIHAHLPKLARVISPKKAVHRVSFDAIAPVLAARNPYAEYYKIAEEIALRAPDPAVEPLGAAKCARAYLMIRFGLHFGLRQKNMRQLLLCKPGTPPRTLAELRRLKCGEIRWDEERGGWEVLLPHEAFKNSKSSFFDGQTWRYHLEDVDGIYAQIQSYISQHRDILLAGVDDPGYFFVKTTSRRSRDPIYSSCNFHSAWYTITQLYGVYNPHTKRGAIKGLIPHGPHNVRDVVATQILRDTHDLRRAGYAIQDTPQSVERHYGRMLPREKVAEAARLLNDAWMRSRGVAA